MHNTQKIKFNVKIFNCPWFMSNPVLRFGKLLIWYLPANDIHQKKEDLETSWKLRDWWNFLDLEFFFPFGTIFFCNMPIVFHCSCHQERDEKLFKGTLKHYPESFQQSFWNHSIKKWSDMTSTVVICFIAFLDVFS